MSDTAQAPGYEHAMHDAVMTAESMTSIQDAIQMVRSHARTRTDRAVVVESFFAQEARHKQLGETLAHRVRA